MEGLEALKEIIDTFQFGELWNENFNAIEKELKDGENYKTMYRLEHEKNQQLSQANLKMSKALDIIKNNCEVELDKECGIYYLNIVCDYGYDMSVVCIKVSKEEYDLLKQVLNEN